MPGLTVDRARDAYRGESKTDARDARVIADQARMRADLGELTPREGELAELQLLLARHRDLIADHTRSITRLRETLLSLFPALERTLDLTNKGALTLLCHYQTPTAIRRVGRKRQPDSPQHRRLLVRERDAGVDPDPIREDRRDLERPYPDRPEPHVQQHGDEQQHQEQSKQGGRTNETSGIARGNRRGRRISYESACLA